MATSAQSAVNEAARFLSVEIGKAFADGAGLIALDRYLGKLHAQLANRPNGKTDAKQIIPSKAEVVSSAEAVARIAADVPGAELTQAHEVVEMELCQLLLDIGIPTATAVRVARAVRERGVHIVTSAWLP